jgi:pimeloyl-ACP methyl ester carboxylesterase
MGGRIAMSFAASYPHLIKALVIEDMDTEIVFSTEGDLLALNRWSRDEDGRRCHATGYDWGCAQWSKSTPESVRDLSQNR